MSYFRRLKDRISKIGDGADRIQIGDPRFDDWEVVHEFEDLATGLAWRDALRERGLDAELTSDWQLDQFNRGDINLQVPPGQWSEAEEIMSGLDLD
jgi:hypothetical protein